MTNYGEGIDLQPKEKDEKGKATEVEVLFSDRQRKMIKQAAEVAKYIYTEVITKPIINK